LPIERRPKIHPGHRTELVVKPVALPEIDASRCVHGLFASANCEACANVCPQRALFVSQDGLGILEENCDGCGLCEPACPQAAITVIGEPGLSETDAGLALFVGCEVTDTGSGCAHRIGLRALADAWRRGVRQIILAKMPCDTCKRGGAVAIEETCDKLNTLLSSRHAKPIQLSRLDPPAWRKSFERAHAVSSGAPNSALSRRQLFRAVVTPVAHRPAGEPARVFLPDTGINPLYAFVPVISADSCLACDACVRICPHDALVDLQQSYAAQPERCVGCGLCVDICESDAVAVHPMASSPPQLKLETRRCGACGAPFRTPLSQAQEKRLCRICEKVNHAQTLYQVLEDPDDDTSQ